MKGDFQSTKMENLTPLSLSVVVCLSPFATHRNAEANAEANAHDTHTHEEARRVTANREIYQVRFKTKTSHRISKSGEARRRSGEGTDG